MYLGGLNRRLWAAVQFIWHRCNCFILLSFLATKAQSTPAMPTNCFHFSLFKHSPGATYYININKLNAHIHWDDWFHLEWVHLQLVAARFSTTSKGRRLQDCLRAERVSRAHLYNNGVEIMKCIETRGKPLLKRHGKYKDKTQQQDMQTGSSCVVNRKRRDLKMWRKREIRPKRSFCPKCFQVFSQCGLVFWGLGTWPNKFQGYLMPNS